MRSVPVVVADVFAQDRPQVPFAVDEYPVGALGPHGARPFLGVTIRAWRPRRGLDHPHALAGEDRVKGTGELGVAVPARVGPRFGSKCFRKPRTWAFVVRDG